MSSDDIDAAVDAASKKAKSSVYAAKDKAAAETSHVMHDAQGAADQAGGVLNRARETIQDLSGRLPDSASDAYRSGRRAYAEGSDSVARRIVKQPIEALLLAGALGYLAGWATSRG